MIMEYSLLLLHTHTVLSRGHSNSPCYRFLSHWGDWIWVRSKSQVIFNTRSQLPEAVVIYTWIVRCVIVVTATSLYVRAGSDSDCVKDVKVDEWLK